MVSEYENMPVMLPATMPVYMPVMVQPDDMIDQEITQTTMPDEITEPVTKTEIFSKILMDGQIFKEFFGSLSALTSECILNINPDSIQVKCVDNANVAMVDLNYRKGIFELYHAPAEPVKVGIDIANIYGLKTMIKKGSLVLMEFTKKTVPAWTKNEKDHKEQITYSYSTSIEGTETKDHALDVNTIRREPNPPVIDLKTRIDLRSEDLIQGIRDGLKVSDKVAMIYDHGNFSMVFEGDTRTMNKSVPVLSSTTTEETFRSRSLFSVDYLKDFVKTMDKKDAITIEMSNDRPVKITRQNELREIVFLLAPRIEAD